MNDVILQDWLEDLGARRPTPGGGAAAGLAVATGAALVSMVANYTTGVKWADRSARMEAIVSEAKVLRDKALDLMEEDAKAFAAVGAAYQLPYDTQNEADARTLTIETALTGAAEPPRQTAELAQAVLVLAQELVATSNPNVISDVAVAASFCRSGLQSAIVNMEINERLIQASDVKAKLQAAIQTASGLLDQADAVVGEVRDRMQAS